MGATVFRGTNAVGVEAVSVRRAGIRYAALRVTPTTICGTDLHIVRGEDAIKPGRVIERQPVGLLAELGTGVVAFA